MKFIKSLLFIMLILSNYYVSGSVTIKRNKRAHVHVHRHLNKAKEIPSFTKMVSEVKGVQSIFFLLLGILSVWRSEAELIYRASDIILDVVESCTSTWVTAFSEVKIPPVEPDAAQGSAMFKEWTKLPVGEKKAFCEKTKETLKFNYDDEGERERNTSRDVSTVFKDWFNVDYNFCEVKFQKMRDRLRKSYGTYEQYKSECNFFRSVDCDQFADSQDAIVFIKKSYHFYKFLKTATGCLIDIKDDIIRLCPGAARFFASGLLDALSTAVSVVMNFLTFGVWGGIKGSYYLFNLLITINEIYKATKRDFAFRLGVAIGTGIQLFKSLVGLRKRKMMMKKMK